jgi:hypothetical protein
MAGKFVRLPISGEVIDFSSPEYNVSLERPRVNAAFFEQYWLKYFKEGGFERYISNHPDEAKEASEFRHRWVEIARGYYSEVEIVDNEGEVLCVVPGLYSRIRTITESDTTLLESAALKLKNATHLARAENEFENTVSSLDFKTEVDTKAVAAQWKHILSIDYSKLKREQKSDVPDSKEKSEEEIDSCPPDYDNLFS